VRATGDIGPLKIISESSIGSNQRRIEALTGFGPIERIRRDEARLRALSDELGVADDELVDAVVRRVAEIKELRDEVRDLRRQAARGHSSELAATAVDGIVVARLDGLPREELHDLAMAVRDAADVRAVVLGSAGERGGVTIVSAVTPDRGLHASELIAAAAKTVGGGTGKAADVATAGGKDASRLDEALDQVRAAAGLPAADLPAADLPVD